MLIQFPQPANYAGRMRICPIRIRPVLLDTPIQNDIPKIETCLIIKKKKKNSKLDFYFYSFIFYPKWVCAMLSRYNLGPGFMNGPNRTWPNLANQSVQKKKFFRPKHPRPLNISTRCKFRSRAIATTVKQVYQTRALVLGGYLKDMG